MAWRMHESAIIYIMGATRPWAGDARHDKLLGDLKHDKWGEVEREDA